MTIKMNYNAMVIVDKLHYNIVINYTCTTRSCLKILEISLNHYFRVEVLHI